jgi:hypothetical protein
MHAYNSIWVAPGVNRTHYPGIASAMLPTKACVMFLFILAFGNGFFRLFPDTFFLEVKLKFSSRSLRAFVSDLSTVGVGTMDGILQ